MTSWTDLLTGDPIATTGTGYQAITSATTVTLTKLYPTKIGMTFTAAGQSLRLWPAETFSVGQSFVVYNLGAETFAIKDNSGTNTIITAQTGTTYLLTLTDNDTDDGAWIATPVGGAGVGTVTSVAITMPTSVFDVANSPVTTSGTIAVTFDTQTANTVFSGPTTGAATTPAFRALVASDYVTMVGDSGSGGTKGAVPAPSAGDAAGGKFLSAGGTWAVPGGTGASTTNSYVVMSAAGDLANERILTSGTGITITDGGAGSTATVAVTNPLPSPSGGALYMVRTNASANAYELFQYVSLTSAVSGKLPAANGGVPPGAILDFGGTAAPSGYLACDGSSYLRADYPDLFSAIGTTWGAVDANHFNVPDFSRRTAVGSGGSGTGTLGNAVGNTGGAETVTLTTNEMPTHSHGVTDPGHTHTFSYATNNSGSFGSNQPPASSASGVINTTFAGGSANTGISINNAGSGAAHDNIQPSAVVLKIIKT